MPLLKLPEELLSRVTEFVAQNHKLQMPYLLRDGISAIYFLPSFLPPTAHLPVRELSLVNHQFRRLCLPFLFCNMECKSLKVLKNLYASIQQNSTEFHLMIRTLVIRLGFMALDDGSSACQTLIHLVPLLPSLQVLDIGYISLTSNFLSIVNAHTTLQTVKTSLYQPLNGIQGLKPLSKIVLTNFGEQHWLNAALEHDIAHRGLRVEGTYLKFTPPPNRSRVLPGLKNLHIDISHPAWIPVDISWLSALVSRHPQLEEIILSTFTYAEPLPPGYPFIQQLTPLHSQASISFIGMVRQDVYARGDTEHKAKVTDPSFKGWGVCSMMLHCSPSVPLKDILASVQTSSDLVDLSLDLARLVDITQDSLINDLASFLPKLKRISLISIGKLLNFSDRPLGELDVVWPPPWETKSLLHSFAARLAAKMCCLDHVFLNAEDAGSTSPDAAFALRTGFCITNKDGGGVLITEDF